MPTYTELMRGFEFGPWNVIPERGLIRDGESEHKIEPLVMDVFVVLASHGGEVVTKDQLIDEVWDGRPQSDDVITRCISALRRGLEDDARHPEYIETVQRRGYRVMLPVNISEMASAAAVIEPPARTSVLPDVWLIVVGLAAVAAIAWFAWLRPDHVPESTEHAASIAVFPFDCLQDSRDSNEHLCFGFAEEAISNLKQVEGVQIVRKRTSYDNTDMIAQDSIVTGSVQIIEDQVKIAVQLEDASNEVVIWSETFDADRSGIFALQRQVANGLRGAIDAGFDVGAGALDDPTSFAAAEAYALGRYLFEKRDHDSIVEAIAQFEEAIRLDSSYSEAWLGLAYTYSIWPDYDLTIDRQSTFDKALEIIAKGIEADPSIQEAAGTVYGYIYHKRNQWADAMNSTMKAVNAKSPGADDYHWHSRVLASVGRLDESLDFARRAAELDPEYPALMSRLAIASFWVDDTGNAARYFDIANRMEFEASIHSLAYSLFLIRQGEIEEAKTWTSLALEEFDLDTSWVDPIFDGIADEGQRPQALALLDQLDASDQMPDNVIMTLSVLLGDIDRAMAVARGAEADSGEFELEIIYIDQFTEFRRHPEFEAFVKGVGLVDYWESAGCDWVNDKIECS